MTISAAQICDSIWKKNHSAVLGNTCKVWTRPIFKSYSNAIALALVDYFSHYYKTQDDPYLETREREERFVAQIVDAVEAAMEKALPVFLSGCITGLIRQRNREKA